MSDNWTRGCDPNDAEAVAASLEEVRLANRGSTGGANLPHHPVATGGNKDASIVADANIQAAIVDADAKRKAQKIDQSVRVAPATPLATAKS